MKLKVKIKAFGKVEARDVEKNGKVVGTVYVDESGSKLLQVNNNGDMTDLFCYQDAKFKAPQIKTEKQDDGKYNVKTHKVNFDFQLLNLGIAMQLPKGMSAHVYPRSSLFMQKSIMLVNSVGIIDNSYNGNNDIWKFGALAFKETDVDANDRIAQFEIVPGKNATFWDKLKWLLADGVEFEFVESLDGDDRGGHGTSGGYGK